MEGRRPRRPQVRMPSIFKREPATFVQAAGEAAGPPRERSNFELVKNRKGCLKGSRNAKTLKEARKHKERLASPFHFIT